MKINIKLPHPSFQTITSAILILIILAEVFVTLNYLYANLKVSSIPAVDQSKIIRADLKGYGQVYGDLSSRQLYTPEIFNYQNSNPFNYGQ
jgi:hypothetical protein